MKASSSWTLFFLAALLAGGALAAHAAPADPRPAPAPAARKADAQATTLAELSKEYESEAKTSAPILADPIRPWNVACFHINDKMYFWLLKPAGIGWRYFLYPDFMRIGVKNFFDNLGFFGRFFNNGFQGRPGQAGIEFARFLTDTTLGVAGFWDPSTRLFHLQRRETDFDETLGRWGMGMGFYIIWPFYGPSSGRGTLGLLGDSVFNPIQSYWAIAMLYWINNISLKADPYETILKMSVDSYTAVHDAYLQNRREKISRKN